MFLTFVTILPLKIPANYRSSSQFLSVGLKSMYVNAKIFVRYGLVNAKIFVRYGLVYAKSVRYGMYRKIRKFDFNCRIPQQFDVMLIRDIDYLCRIAGEYISNLCVRFLETVRNVRLCRAILVVSQRVQMNLIFSGNVQHAQRDLARNHSGPTSVKSRKCRRIFKKKSMSEKNRTR